MGDCKLICNISKCRKELTGDAWVTSCSHIMCREHEPEIMPGSGLRQCPICAHPLPERFDMVLQEVNPSEHFKSMVLAGISPERVMDAAQRAISFWFYQMHQEQVYRDVVVKNARERVASITDYCETVAAQHKIESQKLNRKIELMEKEIEEKTKKIEDLVTQLAEKSRLMKITQNKYDSLKRQMSSSFVTPTRDTRSPYCDLEAVNRRSRNCETLGEYLNRNGHAQSDDNFNYGFRYTSTPTDEKANETKKKRH